MSSTSQPLVLERRDSLGATSRRDAWWQEPLVTAVGLVLFFGYLTYRAFDAS